MVVKIYVDVVFILNFIINALLLYTTARITGEKIKRWRVILSAAVGAAYSVAVFINNSLATVWIKLLIATVMVAIAYDIRKIKRAVLMFLSFFAVSAALGGLAFAINYFTGGGDIHSGIIHMQMPFFNLMLAVAIGAVIVSAIFNRSATGVTKKEIVFVEVIYRMREARFHALVDTGNTLRDPMTNTPVIVVEYSHINELFKRDEDKILRNCSAEEVILQLPAQFRLIPFKTIDGSGFLPAFKPRYVLVNGKERDVLVAICKERVSDGGAYNALIGACGG